MASTSAVNPRKIGFKLEPLSLILLYDDGKKLRKRCMPLRSNLKSTSGPSGIRAKAEEIQLRHQRFLKSVPLVVLVKLVSIIWEIQNNKVSVSQAAERLNAQFSIDTQRDLNLASDNELRHQKDLMDVSFITNAVLPGDPLYVYDKKVAFNPTSNAPSAWDEDDD